MLWEPCIEPWESTLASPGIFTKDPDLFNIILEQTMRARPEKCPWKQLGPFLPLYIVDEASEGKPLALSHTATNGNPG